MTTNHTAPEMLEAVGIDWRADASLHTWDNGLTSTCYYTGPALGTPELDALLLVAGQRWLTKQDTTTKMEIVEAIPRSSASTHQTLIWLMCHCDLPGHALARAIREAK